MKDCEKNPFKKIHIDREVPEEIKISVMKNITLIRLFGEITDLFSVKMGRTAMELLKRGKNNNF